MNEEDDYKEREKRLLLFNQWAEHEGFNLRMSSEFEHSDRETNLAFLTYEKGFKDALLLIKSQLQRE